MTSGYDPQALKRSMRLYLVVGVVLFCGTLATVAVATIPTLDIGEHGFDAWDMSLGLMIAAIKASLVALIFMHLNHERRLIYFFGILAAVHCTGMIALIAVAEADGIHNPLFYQGSSRSDPGGVSVSRGRSPQTDTTPQSWVPLPH
jgi:caa(3)-type oxidase subunit IV